MFEEGRKLRLELGDAAVYDFSLGNPDIEPPAVFGEALERFALDVRRGTHGYMPNAGYPHVRAIVAAHASTEQGLAIPADNIIMTVGAAGAINVALRTILDPGDEVIVLKPWFAEYWFYIQNFGGTFVGVDTRADWHLDLGAIEKALSPRTAAIIVNSPNNPSGVVYGREELAALSELLSRHGRASGRWPCLIADEPYRQIVYDGVEVPSIMALYPETIVATSWSKSLSLPGERIGYLAVSPDAANAREILDGLTLSTRILGFVNAPALLQRVVAEIIESKADISSYAHRGRILTEGLRASGYEFPDPRGAFYVFARVPSRSVASPEDPRDDVAFVMHLKERRILGVPGIGFGAPGNFRLSFCVPEKTIRESLPGFAEALKAW
jgi:aspartate aminotransferase